MLAMLFIEHAEATTEAYDKWTLSDKTGTTLISRDVIDLPLEGLLIEAIQQFPSDCVVYSSLSRFYGYALKLKHRYTPLGNPEAIKNYLGKKDTWSPILTRIAPDQRN